MDACDSSEQCSGTEHSGRNEIARLLSKQRFEEGLFLYLSFGSAVNILLYRRFFLKGCVNSAGKEEKGQ